MIYTKEFVLKELNWFLDKLKTDKDIVYIWELFEDKNYSRQRFSERVSLPTNDEEDRASRYWDDKEVKELSDTIKEILETRAVKWALTNKLNPTFTIFHLKNNYKWKDKQEIDQTLNWEMINKITIEWI